jgi:hypothetical protein
MVFYVLYLFPSHDSARTIDTALSPAPSRAPGHFRSMVEHGRRLISLRQFPRQSVQTCVQAASDHHALSTCVRRAKAEGKILDVTY